MFARLPVDSAKKLRFYDKADLDALITAQAKEKELLYSTCHALQHVSSLCRTPSSWAAFRPLPHPLPPLLPSLLFLLRTDSVP